MDSRQDIRVCTCRNFYTLHIKESEMTYKQKLELHSCIKGKKENLPGPVGRWAEAGGCRGGVEGSELGMEDFQMGGSCGGWEVNLAAGSCPEACAGRVLPCLGLEAEKILTNPSRVSAAHLQQRVEAWHRRDWEWTKLCPGLVFRAVKTQPGGAVPLSCGSPRR